MKYIKLSCHRHPKNKKDDKSGYESHKYTFIIVNLESDSI
jgi:hypothetical protein